MDKVDVNTEERNLSQWIPALEEYKQTLVNERKRRNLKDLIDDKYKKEKYKMELKVHRQARRVNSSPYARYKQKAAEVEEA